MHCYLSSCTPELRALFLAVFFANWSRNDRCINAEPDELSSSLWGRRKKAKTIFLLMLLCTSAISYQWKISQQPTSLSTSFLNTAEIKTESWMYKEWERGFPAKTEDVVAWKSHDIDLWSRTKVNLNFSHHMKILLCLEGIRINGRTKSSHSHSQ